MTTLNNTLSTYVNGGKLKAYKMFIEDETSNADGVTFLQFSHFMEKCIVRRNQEEKANKNHYKFDN